MFTKHPKFVHKICDFPGEAEAGRGGWEHFAQFPAISPEENRREMLLFSTKCRAILSERIRNFYKRRARLWHGKSASSK